MQEVFEKIIDKLEERASFLSDCTKYGNKDSEQQNKSYSTMMMYEVADLVDDLIEIVNQEAADYNNGWIACNSGKLPKENEYVRVTIWSGHEWIGCYIDGKWFVYGAAGLIEATVLAWKTTEPYQPKGE